jgi:hypothetical protein
VITLISALGGTVVQGVIDWFKGQQEITKAAQNNKIKLLQSDQTHNQMWEMKQLENSGWKDDVLFYAFIALFVWSGFDPEGSAAFFMNVDLMPEWFKTTWMWLVASVVGVKKLGDYAPMLIQGVKDALR